MSFLHFRFGSHGSNWAYSCGRLCVCPSIYLSIIPLSVLTLFPFENVSIYFKQISFKCCICIHTKHVTLGIDSSISIIYHRVIALVIVQNSFLVSTGFSFIVLDYHDVKLHKMIEVTKLYISLAILSSEVICPWLIYIYIKS